MPAPREGAITMPSDVAGRRGSPGEPIDVGTERQLLFDDFFTDTREGLRLVMNPPVKTHAACIVSDMPWENWMISGYFTIIQEDGRFRCWYEMWDASGRNGLAYAESDDGVQWTKPSLDVIGYPGSEGNNLVWYGRPGATYHGGGVFIDPTAPSEQKYKLIYWEPHTSNKVCGAVSADGIEFTSPKGKNPIMDRAPDSQQVAFWDPNREAYVAYVRSWEPKRSVSRAESPDCWSFPEPSCVLAPDDEDPDDLDLYTSAATLYPHAARSYLMFPAAFHQTADSVDVQLATSRDGIRWERAGDRGPYVPLGEGDEFDTRMVYVSPSLCRVGDTLRVYYTGYRHGHDDPARTRARKIGVISYAETRLDGFVSMDADGAMGTLVTVPIIFGGSRLEINAAANASAGAVSVGISDESGNPIAGFGLADCRPMKGDDVRHTVQWNQSDLGSLAGTPIRLTFKVREAKLYAFGFR